MVEAFLKDILEHVNIRNIDLYSSRLNITVEKLLTYSQDIAGLIRLVSESILLNCTGFFYCETKSFLYIFQDAFLKLVTLLNVDIIKSVLSAFNTKHSETQNDSILINTVMHLASLVHDSVE